jgi:hypothetical protein
MSSKTILFLTIMVVIISLSNAKTLFDDKSNFEMSSENASVFLHTSTDGVPLTHFDKRESGTDCVHCKLGIVKCCKPTICVSKTLKLDECKEIKVADKSHSHH